jgi:cobalt-zinc-cadmium efflux system outer membrane protein
MGHVFVPIDRHDCTVFTPLPMPLICLSRPLFGSIVCAALALVTESVGQPAPLPAPALTLQAALTRASEHNPHLVALGYTQVAGEALIEQAGQRPLTTLGLSAEDLLGTGHYEGLGRSQTILQVSQTLERGGKREKRITLASHERDVAAADFKVQRAAILAATALAYAHTLAAEQRVVVAADSLKQARELLDSLTARAQSGTAAPTETARSRIALISAQADFARAEIAVASARAKLTSSWAGTSAELSTLVGKLRIPPTLPDEATFIAQLRKNPRITLQQARINSHRSALGVAKAQATSDVTASGGLRYYPEDSAGALVLGVSMPLPMQHYNQGNIRAARATLAGAEQSLNALDAELRAEFAASWQELQSAHASVKTLLQDALPATQDALNLVQRGYAQGEIPLNDVFETQRAQTALRRELLDAEWASLTESVNAD